MGPTGSALLHEVAKRVLARYLRQAGAADIVVSRALRDESHGIDLRFRQAGRMVTAKVKADSYFGTDPHKVANRELPFYRQHTRSYGLESLSDTRTREPGWIDASPADEVLYYRLAITQTEAEIQALLAGPEQVFFSELAVERDELRIIPLPALRAWFAEAQHRYMPRPVVTDGRPAWYRIVPEADVDAEVRGLRVVGAVFGKLRFV